MKELTPGQKECLALIIKAIQTRSIPPSFQELCEWMGVKRTSVEWHVEKLSCMGYIKRAGNRHGYIKLLKDIDGDPVAVKTTITKVSA